MLTKQEIDRLEELLAKATKGEWFRTGPLSEEESCRAGGVSAGLISMTDEHEQVDLLDDIRVHDLDLIVELRNLAPDLIAAARLCEKLKEWRRASKELARAEGELVNGNEPGDKEALEVAHAAYDKIEDEIAALGPLGGGA